jgi:hypothetical protein
LKQAGLLATGRMREDFEEEKKFKLDLEELEFP